MARYNVFWVIGNYPERQEAANQAGCICYVEHHFNALAYDRPETTADNPVLCLVAHNASQRSKNWARDYTKRVSQVFDFRNSGVIQVGYRKRGDYNLRSTKMPAMLVEPLFVSDPTQALIAKSTTGQDRLARILVDCIKAQFPEGGTVAFSVGHKGQPSRPSDRGAPVHDGGWEADLSEAVLKKAARLFKPEPPRLTLTQRVEHLETRMDQLERAC